jgi:hypothetical protein
LARATQRDDDLAAMSRDELMTEVMRLRAGIREHRDSSGHDLCWHHPQLWGLLPEKTDPLPVVPPWPEFLAGCLKYRRSLDEAFPDRVRPVGDYDGENAQASRRNKRS